ncbi:MAG TPA: hypothetical protein VLM79_26380, partial [Kofleriaceae bacterium]|nr:hypothetical protein [Kofleriaceae bacterium]
LTVALTALWLALRAAARQPHEGSADPQRADPQRADRIAPRSTMVAEASWPILLLAIAIGLPFLAVADRQGLGFRLRIAAFVPAALSAAIAVRAVLPLAWRRDRLLAAAALAIVLLRPPDDRVEGQVLTHPALVAAAQALAGHVPAGATLIIPERHIAFMVAWYTRAPIAIRPERIPRDQRMRLLPLHFIGEGSALDRTLTAARAEPSLSPPIGLHPRHPNGLVLVPEATWDWILAHLPAADRVHFARWPTI